MIAPALAPATSSHFVIGFVGCSANPQSAPASARPLTPPPRKTPSASVIHSIAGSSRSRGPPGVHPCGRRARLGPLAGVCSVVNTLPCQLQLFARQLDAERREHDEQREDPERERHDQPRMLPA